ncbi:MAG: hypothetical protein WKF30_02720 [Pyrinomonadaceae bacterium]
MRYFAFKSDSPQRKVSQRKTQGGAEEEQVSSLGEKTSYACVYDCMLAYERGHWDAATAQAATLKVAEAVLPAVYLSSINWVNQQMGSEALRASPAPPFQCFRDERLLDPRIRVWTVLSLCLSAHTARGRKNWYYPTHAVERSKMLGELLSDIV